MHFKHLFSRYAHGAETTLTSYIVGNFWNANIG